MVGQLEGSVLTAIALVMMVVLAALGTRSALLVGFGDSDVVPAVLCSAGHHGCVDLQHRHVRIDPRGGDAGRWGPSVVVEYADRRIREGSGPMAAYVEAAKRMFWPIVSSTATTLCAFSADAFLARRSGAVHGHAARHTDLRFVRITGRCADLPAGDGWRSRVGSADLSAMRPNMLRAALPWVLRVALVPLALLFLFIAAMQVLNPGYLFGGTPPLSGFAAILPGAVLFLGGAVAASVVMGAATPLPP